MIQKVKALLSDRVAHYQQEQRGREGGRRREGEKKMKRRERQGRKRRRKRKVEVGKTRRTEA